MNLTTILGKKLDQTQGFLEDGTRVPLTRVSVKDNFISQIKTSEKDGYMSLQVAFGNKNKISKPMTGHLKKAGLKNKPRFLREIRVDDASSFEAGSPISAEEILAAGDKIDVVGVSKGKGFAGAVKRWHFKGGPKTHGQSDRHRAPGSIGQSTTPGRVYKGKRMAGNMGNDRVTVKNLQIMDIKDGEILIKGLIPGPKNSLVMITKIGENKKFKPLFSEEVEVVEEAPVEEAAEEEKVEAAAETKEPQAEAPAEEPVAEVEPSETETVNEPASEEPAAEEAKTEETSSEAKQESEEEKK